MKSNIPMPVVIGIVVVLVLGLGFFIFKKGNESGAGDVASMANSIKSTRTDLPVSTPQEAAGDAQLMGSRGLKKSGR